MGRDAGRPVHGQLGAVLVEVFNRKEVAGSLARAFQAHGFSLQLSTVGRIDLEKDAQLNGLRVPVHIDAMEFEAAKLPG